VGEVVRLDHVLVVIPTETEYGRWKSVVAHSSSRNRIPGRRRQLKDRIPPVPRRVARQSASDTTEKDNS
jgi:hypothetical protein